MSGASEPAGGQVRAARVPPRVSVAPGRFKVTGGWLLAMLLVLWAFRAVGASPDALAGGLPRMATLASRFWPPDLSADFLKFLAIPMWETAALALAGLVLAIAVGFPLALLGTSTLWTTGPVGGSVRPRLAGRAIHGSARAVLDFMRSVPDIAWALMFVAAIGLGPVPALLALGLSYGGMLGKIYAEIFESLEPYPAEALHAAGSGRTGIVAWAYLPQAWPLLLSYTLYAWECCMRAAAVMGFVGAGGLGYQIDLSMRMFEYGQVATLLLALLALIGAVDLASFFARRMLLAEDTPGSGRGRRGRNAERAIAAVALLALLASGLWVHRAGWLDLFSPQAASGIARFLGGFFPPDVGHAALAGLPALIAQTLAISVAGTVLGAVLGAILCAPAARTVTFDGPFAGSRRLWMAVYHASRLVLNGLRAIPEVLWALIFVLAVGLGPLAGVLAIGAHTGGVLGKLYAEALEEVDFRPVEALVAIGAGRAGAVLFAALPLALPVMTAYTLFRWEMNLRVASILGFVGGGGLGQAIWEAIQLGFYDRLATLILAVLGMVWICDRLSFHLRRGLVSSS